MRIIGHGIDVVDVVRIARMLDEHGRGFLDRCYTAQEQAAGGGWKDGKPNRRYVEHLAARFAAKEAALKALGTGWSKGIGWQEIEVRSLVSGQPTLNVTGVAAEFARELGIVQWHVSMTHTETQAVASVIACGPN